MSLTRRELMRNTAFAGLGCALAAGSIDAVFGASPAFADAGPAGSGSGAVGFGPLVPDPAHLLDLPAGFSYTVLSRAGEALAGGGGTVPGRPDGTASFAGPRGGVYLVTNHEQGTGAPFPAVAPPELTYDPGSGGGTTTLLVDRRGALVRQQVSLAGTFNNCAGGRTPWGSWLTCEETEQRIDATKGITRDHGFVFEVVPDRPELNRDPVPLTALGRFAHEAVAVDPDRNQLYLTEDAGGPNGLLYRFTPDCRRGRFGIGSLRDGGTLEAMLVAGVPDLSAVTTVGEQFAVEWKAIPDPLAATTSVRKQFDHGTTTGTAGGAITRSRKLEGAWWDDRNGLAHIVCSYARLSDGSAAEHDGQVWSFDPRRQRLRLEVRFGLNPDHASDAPDGPDNITVSPFGGLVLAEDGEGLQHLLGVSRSGATYLLARNALNDSEFTGPTFAADGGTLFANIQEPGIQLAIRGPWHRAARFG
jgi:secreted PhoX family phosphatase